MRGRRGYIRCRWCEGNEIRGLEDAARDERRTLKQGSAQMQVDVIAQSHPIPAKIGLGLANPLPYARVFELESNTNNWHTRLCECENVNMLTSPVGEISASGRAVTLRP